MKKVLKDTIDTTIARFMYYDRKEDEDLPIGEIERMVQSGEVSVDEILLHFGTGLKNVLAGKHVRSK